MKKQFLFNILLLVLLNALIKPFWVLGIDRSVQNLVGSEVYGLYFALFNFTVLFNTFLDPGLTNFNNRSIAGSPGLITQYLPRLILIKLILGIIYLLLCVAISVGLGYSGAAFKLIGILAFNQFLASFLLFLRSNISGLQLFIKDSILSVSDRFLMIIFCGLLLWTNVLPFKLNIYMFALMQTLAYAITCIVAIAIVLRETGNMSFKHVPLFSGDLFRKSLPFALLGLLMVAYSRIDAVLLERMLPDGATAAGIYAQSFRIFDAVTMISVIFASLLLPMFSKLLAGKEDIRPLIKLAFSLLFSGTTILAINLTVFASPVLNILYRELHPESVRVFIILSLCFVPVSLTYIFGTLLTAGGKLRLLNIIAGITLFVNILLNINLIPLLGVVGAALSALVSQVLSSSLQIFICRKFYKIRYNWKSCWNYLLLFSISILLAWLFYNLHFALWLKLVVSVSLSFCLTLILKIISLKEIRNAFSSDDQ